MKLATILLDGQCRVGALSDRGLVVLDTPAGTDLGHLLRRGADLASLRALLARSTRVVDPAKVTFLPPRPSRRRSSASA